VEKPNWERYYQRKDIRSLSEQACGYIKAIQNLQKINPDFLKKDHPATIVLGGCAVQNANQRTFQKIASFIHPETKTIVLDLNSQPFKRNETKNPLQTNLTHPPFKKNSIDLLLLDFTQEYLTDKQLKAFSQSFSKCLKFNGSILMANTSHLSNKLASFIQTKKSQVPTRRRSVKNITELFKPHFQITSMGDGRHYELITLTHSKSTYPHSTHSLIFGDDSKSFAKTKLQYLISQKHLS
jgi:hypothetical protein